MSDVLVNTGWSEADGRWSEADGRWPFEPVYDSDDSDDANALTERLEESRVHLDDLKEWKAQDEEWFESNCAGMIKEVMIEISVVQKELAWQVQSQPSPAPQAAAMPYVLSGPPRAITRFQWPHEKKSSVKELVHTYGMQFRVPFKMAKEYVALCSWVESFPDSSSKTSDAIPQNGGPSVTIVTVKHKAGQMEDVTKDEAPKPATNKTAITSTTDKDKTISTVVWPEDFLTIRDDPDVEDQDEDDDEASGSSTRWKRIKRLLQKPLPKLDATSTPTNSASHGRGRTIRIGHGLNNFGPNPQNHFFAPDSVGFHQQGRYPNHHQQYMHNTHHQWQPYMYNSHRQWQPSGYYQQPRLQGPAPAIPSEVGRDGRGSSMPRRPDKTGGEAPMQICTNDEDPNDPQQTARRLSQAQEKNLLQIISSLHTKLIGQPVPASAWDTSTLPPRMAAQSPASETGIPLDLHRTHLTVQQPVVQAPGQPTSMGAQPTAPIIQTATLHVPPQTVHAVPPLSPDEPGAPAARGPYSGRPKHPPAADLSIQITSQISKQGELVQQQVSTDIPGGFNTGASEPADPAQGPGNKRRAVFEEYQAKKRPAKRVQWSTNDQIDKRPAARKAIGADKVSRKMYMGPKRKRPAVFNMFLYKCPIPDTKGDLRKMALQLAKQSHKGAQLKELVAKMNTMEPLELRERFKELSADFVYTRCLEKIDVPEVVDTTPSYTILEEKDLVLIKLRTEDLVVKMLHYLCQKRGAKLVRQLIPINGPTPSKHLRVPGIVHVYGAECMYQDHACNCTYLTFSDVKRALEHLTQCHKELIDGLTGNQNIDADCIAPEIIRLSPQFAMDGDERQVPHAAIKAPRLPEVYATDKVDLTQVEDGGNEEDEKDEDVSAQELTARLKAGVDNTASQDMYSVGKVSSNAVRRLKRHCLHSGLTPRSVTKLIDGIVSEASGFLRTIYLMLIDALCKGQDGGMFRDEFESSIVGIITAMIDAPDKHLWLVNETICTWKRKDYFAKQGIHKAFMDGLSEMQRMGLNSKAPKSTQFHRHPVPAVLAATTSPLHCARPESTAYVPRPNDLVRIIDGEEKGRKAEVLEVDSSDEATIITLDNEDYLQLPFRALALVEPDDPAHGTAIESGAATTSLREVILVEDTNMDGSRSNEASETPKRPRSPSPEFPDRQDRTSMQELPPHASMPPLQSHRSHPAPPESSHHPASTMTYKEVFKEIKQLMLEKKIEWWFEVEEKHDIDGVELHEMKLNWQILSPEGTQIVEFSTQGEGCSAKAARCEAWRAFLQSEHYSEHL